MSQPSHPEQIDRDYIRLLQVMRRFIKEEFAVSIHISQDDAVPQLLRYAAESRNAVLKEMALELEEFTRQEPTAVIEEATDQPSEPVRYYRGAAMSGGGQKEKSSRSDKPGEKTRPARVYRGQVVND